MEQTYTLLYSQDFGALDRIPTGERYSEKNGWIVIAKEIPESELHFLSILIDVVIEQCQSDCFPDTDYISNFTDTFRSEIQIYLRKRAHL